jgi:hypothetical protein
MLHQRRLERERRPHRASFRRGRQTKLRPSRRQRGMASQICPLPVTSNCDIVCLCLLRKSVRRTMSGRPAGHAPNSQASEPTIKTRADTGVTPDCPSAEDSDDVSVTNSEVESAMNHQRRRASLRDPGFTKEAFNAFSLADAYIRAARDGLTRATDQHLKDIRVSSHRTNLIIIYQ